MKGSLDSPYKNKIQGSLLLHYLLRRAANENGLHLRDTLESNQRFETKENIMNTSNTVNIKTNTMIYGL